MKIMPELHAKFGGSTASRTMNCPGWRQLADSLPKNDSSSSFADRGTLLHNAMERIYHDDVEAETVIGMEYNGIILTEELFKEKIVPAVAAVEEVLNTYNIDTLVCEEKVTLADDAWGTADMIGAGEEWAIVLDYKFGDGIMVSPVENDQFLFYGSGAYHTKRTADLFDDVEKVAFVVVQPKPKGSAYSVWETTSARLRDYREPYLAAVSIAKGPDPLTCAGNWCKFCPASSICPQKTGSAQRAMLLNPTDLDTIRESLKLAKELETWIATVRATAHEQLEKGAAIKGWKLVMKRATRKWDDDDKVAKYLARKFGGRKNVIHEKVITPAQAETMAKTDGVELNLDGRITAQSSGTTLAAVTDKRPAIVGGKALEAALASIH
jgi:hypothetical protein